MAEGSGNGFATNGRLLAAGVVLGALAIGWRRRPRHDPRDAPLPADPAACDEREAGSASPVVPSPPPPARRVSSPRRRWARRTRATVVVGLGVTAVVVVGVALGASWSAGVAAGPRAWQPQAAVTASADATPGPATLARVAPRAGLVATSKQADAAPTSTAQLVVVERIAPDLPDWLTLARSAPPSSADVLAGALLPLRGSLAEVLAGFEAEAGIAVIDLGNGDRIEVNGWQQFQAASTIKFFVVLSALRDIGAGAYAFSEIEAELYGIMVRQSNVAARALTRRTTIEAVNQRLDDWGLRETVMTHPAGFGEETAPGLGQPYNLTSPRDAAQALALLYAGQIAEPGLSRQVIERMTQAPRRWGIEGAVPDAEGHVFYKVGWLPEDDFSAVHDIAIVEFERGGQRHAYAIAIYTQGARPQGPAWELVRTAAETVWDYFATVRYPDRRSALPFAGSLPAALS